MKNLITIFIMLVVVGCGKSEVENKRFEAELKEEQRKSDAAAKATPKELTLEEKVVGEYEITGKDTVRVVLLRDGIVESYLNGNKREKGGKWGIGKDEELHIEDEDFTCVYRINQDGSITVIARISKDGKREETPKGMGHTAKRIK